MKSHQTLTRLIRRSFIYFFLFSNGIFLYFKIETENIQIQKYIYFLNIFVKFRNQWLLIASFAIISMLNFDTFLRTGGIFVFPEKGHYGIPGIKLHFLMIENTLTSNMEHLISKGKNPPPPYERCLIQRPISC